MFMCSIYVICTAQVIDCPNFWSQFLPRLPWCVPPLLLPSCLPPRSMEFVEFSLWCSLDLPGSDSFYISPFSYMNLIWSIYVPRVSKLAASCSFHKCHPGAKATPVSTDRMALRRSTSFSSPRLSFATQLLGWHYDIIMISSWYHEPRKGSIKIHLNCCCQILWAHFLNRISVHLNMTPGDKLDKCWDSSKARENHVASLICPELLNQQIWTSFAEEKASSHMLNDKLAQKKTHANAVLRPEQQRRGFQDRHRTMAACLLDLHSSPWKVSTSSCLRTAR